MTLTGVGAAETMRTRIDVSAKKTDPVRVVVEIPVEDLGLNEVGSFFPV